MKLLVAGFLLLLMTLCTAVPANCQTGSGKDDSLVLQPDANNCVVKPVELGLSPPAGEITIDFEDVAGPNVFVKSNTVSCLNGDVTFTGGQVLAGETFLFADLTKVYGTSFYCDGCRQTITITFAKPVTQYSLLILNGETAGAAIDVEDDTGKARFSVKSIHDGGSIRVSNKAEINKVTVMRKSPYWNFSIDDVKFTFK